MVLSNSGIFPVRNAFKKFLIFIAANLFGPWLIIKCIGAFLRVAVMMAV